MLTGILVASFVTTTVLKVWNPGNHDYWFGLFPGLSAVLSFGATYIFSFGLFYAIFSAYNLPLTFLSLLILYFLNH
jgi:hypothetical protein